jgi:oligo-1,6-glucosidase
MLTTRVPSQHARTPMQWDTSANAGFCPANVKPWMRVMEDFQDGINAQSQMDQANPDELSTWQFWQRGIHDRKKHADVFVYGDYQEVAPDHPDVLAYGRTSASSGERWLVVLNFSGKDVEWALPEAWAVDKWACSTYSKAPPEKPRAGTIPLRPWEGVLAKCRIE